MKHILISLIPLLLFNSAFSQFRIQSPNPRPIPIIDFINSQKKTVVPIILKDRFLSNKEIFSGTGSLITDSAHLKLYILTCEHVIRIKDSLGRFLKYSDNIYAILNLSNDSSVKIRLVPVYHDSINDFSLLEISSLPTIPSKYKWETYPIPFSFLSKTENLKEGETIFYCGYPMAFGVGKKNHPVSRVGIISQIVQEYYYILIDGFVQGGYSGSPVYSIRRVNNNSWEIDMIGIIQAYPTYYENIISSKSGLKEERLAVINSGFTYVIKLDIVINILRTKFGF